MSNLEKKRVAKSRISSMVYIGGNNIQRALTISLKKG